MTASRPAGILNGNSTLASQPIEMMPSEIMPIQPSCQTWNAGAIAMNVIATPASVPSIAARGVSLRSVGPMNAPK